MPEWLASVAIAERDKAKRALENERERCAQIADRYDQGPGDGTVMGPVMSGQVAVAQDIAAAIREG